MKLSKYFFPVLYLRKLIFGVLIVFPTEHVYFQISALITLNFAMLLFLILVFPYESKHENIKTCAGEIVLIGICIAALFLVNDEEA